MKTKLYSLLLFTFLFINGYSQHVTVSTSVCGTWQFDSITVDGTGRTVFGYVDDVIWWNSTSNQWSWDYYGSGGHVIYYTNSYPSTPNPPCFNTGTWVQTNNGCGTLLSITGDCQTGLTGINKNVDSENYFSISPNPASDYISILLHNVISQNTTISIFNSLGENICEKAVSTFKTEIDLSDQSNGIYFVQLRSDEGIFYKKIILSR